MIFFTSDLHLGHENCIRLCNRPFSSIEEMDETLIENWNRKITGKDTVYILGDLIYISWWLYDAAPDYEVWTDDEKTKWCLMEPEALYDFIRDECQG